MQINVTDDNVRPLVVIQNGTGYVNITVSAGKMFNGLIYSSGDVNVTLNSGSFCGGISAKNISVENTGDGASSFTQTNYLQSDAEIYNKISKYAFEHGQLSGEVSTTNPPSYTYTNSWQEWYTLVGLEAAANWFSNLSESRKLAFWRSWDDANRPLNSGLWDWWYNGKWKEDWFFADWNPTEQQISDAKNDEPVEIIPNYKLRLVNPRLEANPFTKTSS